MNGKLLEFVSPVTYALPAASTTIPRPRSEEFIPPRYVEYTSAVPAGLTFVTKASMLVGEVVSNAPVVVGKFVELVSPVTYALPEESTAIALPSSEALPPRNVE